MHRTPAKSGFRLISSQVAEAIVGRILAGELCAFLPGEIELAAHFNVSRPTVRIALRQLEAAGRIGPGHPGRRRAILMPQGIRDESRPGRVRIILSKPTGELPPSYQDSLADIRRRLQAAGHPVEVEYHRALWNTQHPGKNMAPVFSASAACFLVLDPTPGMEKWLEREQIPCVCLGGTYLHNLPRVGSEGDITIVRAARELIALGHSRIIYPIRDQYGIQMADALRGEMDRHALGREAVDCAPSWHGDAANAVALYERLFNNPMPPTAFITLGILNLLPLITWLGHRGLRVPHDVSIIHLLDDPLLASIHPPLTCYKASPVSMRRSVTRMVIQVAALGGPCDMVKMLPMRRHGGHSTAPPPDGINQRNPTTSKTK
jgi:DNA-binding LacI/PurR family transcriptional regulator